MSIRACLRVNMADKEERAMKYILLIYGDEREWASMSKEDLAKVYEKHGAYSDAMVKAGVMRGGYELQPVATATSLRFTNGKPKTSDGPFAETKEQLGGYYIVEVDTLDQAIEWAEKMPAMGSGTVEIRPLGAGS
jgi:hypothetical protein